MRKSTAVVLLGGYGLFFLGITLLILPSDHPRPNLVPFRTMRHDWQAGGKHFVVNFLGNIFAFIPFGVLFPLSRSVPTRLSQAAVACLAFSTIVEALQFLSGRRVADVDDVLLNTLGGVLGFLLLHALRRWRGNAREIIAVDSPAG